MFKPIRTLDGSSPVTKYLQVDQIDVTNGDVLCWSTSGYVTNPKNGSAVTELLAGVAEESISSSDVTAGVTMIATQVNPLVVYRVDCSADVARTDVGTNVGFDAAGTADGAGNQYVQESVPNATGNQGVCRIINMVTTSFSATAQAADVTLNFRAPTHL